LYEPVEWLLRAHGLAGALERRHQLAPFQLVQSAEWVGTGLMVRRRAGRVHAVRCSAATDLYNAIEGKTRPRDRARERLERWTLRRADIAFAPSRFVADHFRRVHDIDVRVLRPPAWLETAPAATPTVALPCRFLLHFGQLSDRKGSSLLAQALPIAWEQAPSLSMVWSGRCWEPGQVDEWRRLWGARAHRVQITGPLPRPELYAVLKRAEAAILPSQVDNLPNTVIESLMLGVPVIGTRGASIDELVEEDMTGHLVPCGDAGALAATLVRIWSRASPVRKGFEWDSAIRDEMQPEKAATALARLGTAGFPASPSREGRLERAECP
jgi:glycosyltransferase involved in cell wall biosynthesis